jgi:hypothetical protein
MRLSFFLIAFFLFSSILSATVTIQASDSEPTINRRQFVMSASACFLLNLIHSDGNPKAHLHRWSIHPESDIETLGLETFGDSVKALLIEQKYIVDETVSIFILNPSFAWFHSTRMLEFQVAVR